MISCYIVTEIVMLKNTMIFKRKIKENLITKRDRALFYMLDGCLSVLFYFITGMSIVYKFGTTAMLIVWIILFILDIMFAYITRVAFFIHSQIQKYYER